MNIRQQYQWQLEQRSFSMDFPGDASVPMVFSIDGREQACLNRDEWMGLKKVLDIVFRTKAAKKAPARAGLVWSEEEDTEVARRHAQGESATDIGKAMLRSRGSITARLIMLGLLHDTNAFGRPLSPHPDTELQNKVAKNQAP